jgi:lipopolysaccharide export system protein LptA
MKKILLISSLLALCLFLLTVETEKSYRLIHSDNVTLINAETGYVSRFEGKVHFFYGGVEYRCNKAMIYEGREFAYMYGDVHAQVDTMDVVADSISFDKRKNILYMGGNIEIKEFEDKKLIREFYSDYGEFERESQYLKVRDNVRSFSYKDSVSATCGYAEFNNSTGYGYMRMSPVLTLTKRDSLRIRSEKVEIFHKHNKYVASFNVHVDHESFTANSNFLIYFSEEDKAILTGDPEFFSDFATANADEFTLFLDNNKLNRALLSNNCLVRYASVEGEPQSNWVKSTQMEMFFEDNDLTQFIANKDVSYFYDQKEDKPKRQDAMQMFSEADELVIRFKANNKVKSLELNGRINGKYRFFQ